MNYLSSASDEEAKRVMKFCSERRKEHRFHRDGYSNDRDKSLRHIASFPVSFLFHPEYKKYFDPNMDVKERSKGIEEILKKFSEFKTVDRY